MSCFPAQSTQPASHLALTQTIDTTTPQSWQQPLPQQAFYHDLQRHYSAPQAYDYDQHSAYDALNYFDLSSQHVTDHSEQYAMSTSLAHQFAAMQPQQGVAELSEGDSEDGADEDESRSGQSIPTTSAERVAQKKRMKRFRLTHAQTRFLVNEFIRHPHPDAAHRERLSQEIPGLSPRQVQVWFQNRRAKLKRLSPEDRERMLKSRTLPDGFNSPPTQRPNSAPNSAVPQAEPWLSGNPGTSIATMNDLKALFIQGVDAISAPHDYHKQDHIQSIISQNSYPSPLSTNDRPASHVKQRSTPFDDQHAFIRQTVSEEEEHPDAAIMREEWSRRSQQGPSQRTCMLWGRELPWPSDENS